MMLQVFTQYALIYRWTVHDESLASVITNYSNIQLFWETAVSGACDTELKTWICSVDSQMQTLSFSLH